MCCHWTLTARTRWCIVTLYSHAAPLDRHHKCGARRLCTPPFVAARTLTRRVSVHFRVTHHCVLYLPAVAFAIVSHRWPCGLMLLARCPGCCALSCAAIVYSRPARACVLSHCTRMQHHWTDTAGCALHRFSGYPGTFRGGGRPSPRAPVISRGACSPQIVAARTVTRRVSVQFRVTHHCVLYLPAVALAFVSHRWPCGLMLLARCPGVGVFGTVSGAPHITRAFVL